jgi:LysM repeat protein
LGGRKGQGALAVALFGLGCGGLGEPFDWREWPRREHVVAAEGESVCALAGRYGVAAPAILRANGLTGSGKKLAGGTRVRLPSEPLRHRIVQGETLADLARWYGLPVTTLAKANGISDPDQIAADHWLRVPPGARTGCPPPIAVARAPAEQPAPETESSVARAPAEQPEAETQSFDAVPLTTVARAPVKQPAPNTECSQVEARRMLERAQSSYDAAHFEEALDLAKASQRLLETDGGGRESDRLRARAAWISGLSYAGFGRAESAVAAFRTALELDPSLGDQEAMSAMSPKVRTLVESARLASVAAPPQDNPRSP